MQELTRTMTIEEFQSLPETTQHIELIKGELVVSPAPRYVHQKRVFSVAKVIDTEGKGGVTVLSPMDVYIGDDTVVQPDIFWVARDSDRCILKDDGYWHGAPDLIIEILSPSTAKYDRSTKYELYEKYGVDEYWVVEPLGNFLEVYALVDGKFARVGVFGLGESFVSRVLGNRTIDVDALFAA